MNGRHKAPLPGQRILRDRHRAVEDARRLDASAVFRAARRQRPELWKRWAGSGDAVLLPVRVPMTRDGVPAGEADVVLALDGARAVAALPDGQSVALVPRPANLRVDGMRWSWICPKSGRLCEALLLPPGADGFASRQAHGLHYRAERERPAERAMRKVRKVRARLGDTGPAPLGAPPPPRPLRMRAHVYARLVARLMEAEDQARGIIMGMAARG